MNAVKRGVIIALTCIFAVSLYAVTVLAQEKQAAEGPLGILWFIVFCVFILGFFLDWIEVCFIILPLIAPLVADLDFRVEGYGVVTDPKMVWFLLVLAMTLQTSFLTPPVGFALFYLKGIVPPEVTLADIYRGVIPFVILQLVGVFVVSIWPQLVTWLPAVAYR